MNLEPFEQYPDFYEDEEHPPDPDGLTIRQAKSMIDSEYSGDLLDLLDDVEEDLDDLLEGFNA